MGVNGIYGLSGSGMDIESMVKVGMMSKQSEYDKMAQKYTKNEWTKSAYLELNNNINTFNMSTLSQYKMSSSMNAKSAESTSSDIKVDANASAPIMNHKVEVTKLSAAAYLVSTARDANGNIIPDQGITRYQGASSSNIELKNILFQTLTYDKTTETITAVKTGPNPDSTSFRDGYSSSGLSYSDKAISFYLNDGTSTDNGGKGVEISFTYKEIIDGATLNDLASRINGKGINVRAAYDAVNDKFSLYNTKGGEENTIKIHAGDNTRTPEGKEIFAGSSGLVFLNNLNLTQVKNGEIVKNSDNNDRIIHIESVLGLNGKKKFDEITGENGEIVVDGMKYATTDNKANVGGITYTALAETKETPATVTVSQNVDSIVDKVKSFVADYNKLLAGLYEKYDEKPDSNYKPLTQSQKDAMKEEQITKWEEKAKKGLLYHDKTIGKIITDMRDAISSSIDSVEGKYNSAYSIGISTTGLKGQLVLNEDKLRKALADDSDAVYNVFAKLDTSKKDSSGNVIDNPDGNGIAQRLGDIFNAATKAIKSRAGSSDSITEDSDLNSLLRQLQTKMSNFKKMMNSFEDRLYKKYDTMETTLAKLGAQLNFVMGGNQ